MVRRLVQVHATVHGAASVALLMIVAVTTLPLAQLS